MNDVVNPLFDIQPIPICGSRETDNLFTRVQGNPNIICITVETDKESITVALTEEYAQKLHNQLQGLLR